MYHANFCPSGTSHSTYFFWNKMLYFHWKWIIYGFAWHFIPKELITKKKLGGGVTFICESSMGEIPPTDEIQFVLRWIMATIWWCLAVTERNRLNLFEMAGELLCKWEMIPSTWIYFLMKIYVLYFFGIYILLVNITLLVAVGAVGIRYLYF